MDGLKLFQSSEFGQVRTVMMNGQAMFSATDVAKCLGYSNPNDAVIKHCKSNGVAFCEGVVKTGFRKDGTPYEQRGEIKVITKGNVIRLVANSTLPTAERVECWIFDEVIPAVLETGGYIATKREDTPEEIMARALTIAQQTLAKREERIKCLESDNAAKQEQIEAQEQAIAVKTEENKVLKASVERQAPMVEYVSTTLQSPKTYTSTQMAKELGMRTASELHNKLQQMGIMYKQSGQWLLTSKYCGMGYTKPRTTSGTDEFGRAWSNTITVWTEKGRMFLHGKFDSKDTNGMEAARVLHVQHGGNVMTGETPAAV